jgi:hypothetical protein
MHSHAQMRSYDARRLGWVLRRIEQIFVAPPGHLGVAAAEPEKRLKPIRLT